MNDLLLALLRFLLFDGENPLDSRPPLDNDAWQQLFDLSRREAVTALTYDAVCKLPKEQRPPRRVLFHFVSVTQTVEQDNQRREAALEHFAERVQSALSLPTTVVKGSSLARCYPVPLHRECGDNDLLTASDTASITALFERQGIAIDRRNPRHAVLAFEGTTFELHNYLLYGAAEPQWNPRPFTGRPASLWHLPAAQEAFFLANQVEYRSAFFHEPATLRNLLDWSLLMRSPELDYEAFRRMAKGTHVELFADLLSAYCAQCFSLTLPFDAARLASKRLMPADFERLYRQLSPRHPRALVRVARRSWHYLRYGRKFRALYGQSMFRRFYLHNLLQALRQHFGHQAS